MVKEKILIKCDKCGSTNVTDNLHEEVEVKVLSMDEYIKSQQGKSVFGFTPIGSNSIGGTSRMDKRIMECRDCGYCRLHLMQVKNNER